MMTLDALCADWQKYAQVTAAARRELRICVANYRELRRIADESKRRERKALKRLAAECRDRIEREPDYLTLPGWSVAGVSDRYLDMTGRKEGEVLGRGWAKLVAPEDFAFMPDAPETPDQPWMWPIRVRLRQGVRPCVAAAFGTFKSGILVSLRGLLIESQG